MGEGHVLRTRAGLPVLTWPALEQHGARVVVTTRAGGVSEGPYATLNLGLHVGDDPERVVVNRARAAAAVGLTLDDLVTCRQRHGREVVVVGGMHRGRGARSTEEAVADADALVTSEAGVGLMVLVADCVPIVLLDPVAGVLAAVHAGWRGTVADVAGAAVAVMAARGADAGRMLARLGPAIAPAAYEVGDDVAAAARDAFGHELAGRLCTPKGDGTWTFDLWSANEALLRRAGVPAAQIATGRSPTGGEHFFSHRLEGPCGRFGLLARLVGPGEV